MRAEVEREIDEVIEFDLEGLRSERLPIPKPASVTRYVEATSP